MWGMLGTSTKVPVEWERESLTRIMESSSTDHTLRDFSCEMKFKSGAITEEEMRSRDGCV